MSYDCAFDPRPVRRTRKLHRCNWCGEDIPPGISCYAIAGVHDGDFSAAHMQEECEAAWRTMPLDETYEVEGMARGRNGYAGDPEPDEAPEAKETKDAR